MTRPDRNRKRWIAALPFLLACGPSSRSPGGSGGSEDGGSTTETGSLSAEDTGTPFACPGARWYEGNLSIDDSTDIDALRDVGGVTGRAVQIVDTTNLVDLEFLSCLEQIGPQEASTTLSIHGNLALQSLHGLERLEIVGSYGEDLYADGRIYITENAALEGVAELSSLESIAVFVLWANPSLVEIELPATRRMRLLDIGGLGGHYNDCMQPFQPSDQMALTSAGHYPVLETLEDVSVANELGVASLASLVEAADRGATFEYAEFYENPDLPDAEIETFAAAAGIQPRVCKATPDDPDECWPRLGMECGGE